VAEEEAKTGRQPASAKTENLTAYLPWPFDACTKQYSLLNDLGKEKVTTDITAWIEARLPGGAKSGADY
jgi:hypothetical protein